MWTSIFVLFCLCLNRVKAYILDLKLVLFMCGVCMSLCVCVCVCVQKITITIMRPVISDKFPMSSNGCQERDHHAENEENCNVAGYLKQFIFWPGSSLPGFVQHPELSIYPVVAGNQHLYNERMCCESDRLRTFAQLLTVLQIFVTQAARNGFYVENGTILCFACGGVHPNHTGMCVRNNENIPFSFCLVPPQAPFQFQAADLNVTLRAQGMAAQQSNEAVMTGVNIQLRPRFWQESAGLADQHGTSRGGRPGRCPGLNSRTGSSHPRYCLPLQRQESFRSFPELAHLASRLAQRGFFAVNSRIVQCWMCGEQILVADL